MLSSNGQCSEVRLQLSSISQQVCGHLAWVMGGPNILLSTNPSPVLNIVQPTNLLVFLHFRFIYQNIKLHISVWTGAATALYKGPAIKAILANHKSSHLANDSHQQICSLTCHMSPLLIESCTSLTLHCQYRSDNL